jgi:hypothetical protein
MVSHSDDKAEIVRLIEYYDAEAVCELLGKILPPELPRPEEVFRLSDEDFSEELEKELDEELEDLEEIEEDEE